VSPICKNTINFSWCEIYRKSLTNNTLTGEVKPTNENGIDVSANYRLSDMWAKMLDRYGMDWRTYFVKYNASESYSDLYWKYYSKKIKNSVYNFIYYSNLAVADTYANWIFKNKGTFNAFGF